MILRLLLVLTVMLASCQGVAAIDYRPGGGLPGGGPLGISGGGTGATTAAGARANLGVAVDGIPITLDGGGAVISTGIKYDYVVPFNLTITSATLLADQTGSLTVDLWKDTYANYPPTVADSITAAAKPTITASNKSQDNTLTGWTINCTAGDIIRINVDSSTSITRAALFLGVTRN